MSLIPNPEHEPKFVPEITAGAIGKEEIKPFPIRPIGSASASIKRRQLVTSLIDEGALVLLYGSPGAGKSFLLIDLFCSIATNIPWLGLNTQPGIAFYVGLEGEVALPARIAAWKADRNKSPDNCFEVVASFDFQRRSDVERLIATIKQGRKDAGGLPAIVGIDTLSRAIPGQDENSQAIISAVVAGCSRIRKETGATVVLVHHPGKTNWDEPRGNSALLGAVDTSLLVKSTNTATGTLVEKKQRDSARGREWRFRLNDVDVTIGTSKETSCVPELISSSAISQTTHVATNPENDPVFKALKSMLFSMEYRRQSDGDDAPLAIPVAEARKRVGCLWPRLSEDAKRKKFDRAVKKLQASGQITRDENGNILLLPLDLDLSHAA